MTKEEIIKTAMVTYSNKCLDEVIKYLDELMSVDDDRLLELVKRKVQQLKQQNNGTKNSLEETAQL